MLICNCRVDGSTSARYTKMISEVNVYIKFGLKVQRTTEAVIFSAFYVSSVRRDEILQGQLISCMLDVFFYLFM